MGKLHKTLRIEEGTAARVEALKAEGESEAAAYTRVIRAGLDALEAAGTVEEPSRGGDQAALVRSLAEHVDTLKAANAELSAQLGVKDSQIEALTNITKAAQTLQGMAHKQLEEPDGGDVLEVSGENQTPSEPRGTEPKDGGGSLEEPKRRGLFSRIFG